MNEQFDYTHDDATCPSCNYGRVRVTHQPYVRVFRGHLFTVPHAICFVCDVCEYCEYDEAIVDVMGEMIFVAQSGVGDLDPEDKPSPTPTSPLLQEDSDVQGTGSRANL